MLVTFNSLSRDHYYLRRLLLWKLVNFQLPLSGSLIIRAQTSGSMEFAFNSLSRDHEAEGPCALVKNADDPFNSLSRDHWVTGPIFDICGRYHFQLPLSGSHVYVQIHNGCDIRGFQLPLSGSPGSHRVLAPRRRGGLSSLGELRCVSSSARGPRAASGCGPNRRGGERHAEGHADGRGDE